MIYTGTDQTFNGHMMQLGNF